MKKILDSNGFSALEIALFVIVMGLLGGSGYYVYTSQKDKSTDTTKTNQSVQQNEEKDASDSNSGYLVVKQWGLRFKTPAGLSNVEFVIKDETVAFFGKPLGYDVEYRADYKKQTDGDFQYALGRLYRSSSSTNTNDALELQQEGKKVGDYYYYTEHAFSSLATGAAPNGLYFDASCDQDASGAKCEGFMKAESEAFQLFNGEAGFLRSIQLAK